MNIIPFVQSNQLGEYEDKLVDLYMADAALNQAIPDSIRNSTEWLLRLVNCFYSLSFGKLKHNAENSVS